MWVGFEINIMYEDTQVWGRGAGIYYTSLSGEFHRVMCKDLEFWKEQRGLDLRGSKGSH